MAESEGDLSVISAGGAVTIAEAAAIDAGLCAHMRRIYNYMALGLVISGIAALGIYVVSGTADVHMAARITREGIDLPVQYAPSMYLTPLGYTVFVSPVKWAIILAPLTLAFALSFGIDRLRPAVAQVLFWAYAAMMGLSLGVIFIVYTRTSVVRVFFVTAAAFGGLSLWGYMTRRNLSASGSFLVLGLSGIILAGIVNLFLTSTVLQWLTSSTGVLVFAGLTAWDTQRLKGEYIYGAMDGDAGERAAIMGALSLYLDFMNLFTMLLEVSEPREE
jgi:uncharacterized protein